MSDILVAVSDWDTEPWAAALGALLPDRQIHTTGDAGVPACDPDRISRVRYLLAWKPPADLFAGLTGLEAIFSLGAGVDHLIGLPLPAGVPVVRIVDADLTGRMAEYVVWRVLDHHRRGTAYRAQQAAGSWKELPQPAAREVAGGIMGLGVLGRASAEILLRLGFAVRGWSRTPKDIAGVASFAGDAGLPRFLAGTDILVALLPLTEETRGILNYGLFRQLRRDGPLGGPVLINAGRGGSQVEADIERALDEATLREASLDVFGTEPLPPASSLWRRPEVTITPHNAAVSDPIRLSACVAAQIRAHERGEPLHNVVNAKRGY